MLTLQLKCRVSFKYFFTLSRSFKKYTTYEGILSMKCLYSFLWLTFNDAIKQRHPVLKSYCKGFCHPGLWGRFSVVSNFLHIWLLSHHTTKCSNYTQRTFCPHTSEILWITSPFSMHAELKFKEMFSNAQP